MLRCFSNTFFAQFPLSPLKLCTNTTIKYFPWTYVWFRQERPFSPFSSCFVIPSEPRSPTAGTSPILTPSPTPSPSLEGTVLVPQELHGETGQEVTEVEISLEEWSVALQAQQEQLLGSMPEAQNGYDIKILETACPPCKE